VVRHRNHLDIMSASAHPLEDDNSTLYSFFTAQTYAYGTNPMKLLETGVYGLYTGDVDGSGACDATDRNLIYNDRNKLGYRSTDVDLSRACDATDRNMTYNNRNIVTRVP